MECREPTTKKEWLKERNKTVPTKMLTKKDVDDPEQVGTIVKDHDSVEIAIPLDFGEDWTTFWPKLEKLVHFAHWQYLLSLYRWSTQPYRCVVGMDT